ncbi:uncharacterized protein ColSpa_00840 [Colletotrichum spaethianum]|uniref:Uncharacterized protein n=1 Tax=Colletotrichum spaethianum TaxID=700344 RepID=A0AA37L4Y7_9PEZI|nr:uncharacterized protein ColSpa_00840 [Colletotrichum spaethianum]GKT40659.1 hypothetical protein ColSpa_00840 [Colletotrichum spaethianum]
MPSVVYVKDTAPYTGRVEAPSLAGGNSHVETMECKCRRPRRKMICGSSAGPGAGSGRRALQKSHSNANGFWSRGDKESGRDVWARSLFRCAKDSKSLMQITLGQGFRVRQAQ